MKKTIATMLALLLTVSGFVVTANATTFDDITFTLEPSQQTVEAGDILDIEVSVSKNRYVMGGTFYLMYDSSAFEFVDGFGNCSVICNDETPGVILTTIASASGARNPLVTYEFTVKADAAGGVSNFTFTTDGFSIDDGTNTPGGVKFGGNFNIENTSVTIERFATHSELRGGDSLEFAVNITKCPSNGVIYAALYNEERLQACEMYSFTSPVTSKSFYFDNSVVYDSAKVFIWDSNGVPLLETPENVGI